MEPNHREIFKGVNVPNKQFCQHCGQSIMRHKQSLSKSLVAILVKSYESFGSKSFHLQKDLSLTKNQYANFQKLKYWVLVTRDEAHAGHWRITFEGIKFLEGTAKVSRFVWTFNNRVVDCDGPMVYYRDVTGSNSFYKKREEYASDAQPQLQF